MRDSTTIEGSRQGDTVEASSMLRRHDHPRQTKGKATSPTGNPTSAHVPQYSSDSAVLQEHCREKQLVVLVRGEN